MSRQFGLINSGRPALGGASNKPSASAPHWRKSNTLPPQSILQDSDLVQPAPNLFAVLIACLTASVTGVGLGGALFYLFFVRM